MARRPTTSLLCALCVGTALLAGTPTAGAQSVDALRTPLAEGAGPARDEARAGIHRAADDEAKRPRPNVEPGEAARRASREYGGRVLNVVLEEGPGGPYYRVKLLDGGRVRIVHVEARH